MTRDALSKACEAPQTVPSEDRVSELELSRRTFVQMLGSGLLVTVLEGRSLAQRRRRSRGRRGAQTVAARLHVNRDGTITVMTGKVEEGQGPRAQLTQAAAEELHVGADQIKLVMADTALVPDDGITAGSRTTPRTVPAVREGAATARRLLTRLAAEQWEVEASRLDVRNGRITDRTSQRTISYADLAASPSLAEVFQQQVPAEVALKPLPQWNVLGTSVPRPNIRDLVTGSHRYPFDITRPGMLYGKVLRPPAYRATLQSIDLSVVERMQDVIVLREGAFVGVAAPTTFRAEQALQALADTATWNRVPQLSDRDLFAHLQQTAGRGRPATRGAVENALATAKQVLNATYQVAYIQHAPMEPRAATAQWQDGKLTVWAGVDWPQRIQRDLAQALDVPAEQVRVIVPDMGGGFGGKHTGEAAEEAARLARAAGRPVAVRWTRAEEFTWAYFRPAAVIECRAGLDSQAALVAWDFRSINPGGAAIETPYTIANTRTQAVSADAPLRQGAYRCLGATANNFARESFMDELAAAADADPLDFRLAHLQNERLRRVVQVAAEKFGWSERRKQVTPERGIGLACGTEKDSVVAACVEVLIDRQRREIKVWEVCEAFECGPIQNPANLTSQVQGCILMGLAPALRERIRFAGGRILNANFGGYQVSRFEDVPKIDVHLVPNPDIPSAGAGETPIIAIAPAIANAVCAATGLRIRSMPIRLPAIPPG